MIIGHDVSTYDIVVGRIDENAICSISYGISSYVNTVSGYIDDDIVACSFASYNLY